MNSELATYGAGGSTVFSHRSSSVRPLPVIAYIVRSGPPSCLAGAQGESHDSGAVVQGNVIEDTRTPYNFGLYTDYGAAWVTLEGNVVVRADSTAILHVSPPLDNVVFRGNFWDAAPIGADAPPAGVTYEGNTVLTGESDRAAADAIRAQAGRRRAAAG